jgi:hypothetical protein
VQPCVRPIGAVHMTAGHNAFRGSGPGQKPAFEMHWHKWVVLIAGSTGFCVTCCLGACAGERDEHVAEWIRLTDEEDHSINRGFAASCEKNPQGGRPEGARPSAN